MNAFFQNWFLLRHLFAIIWRPTLVFLFLVIGIMVFQSLMPVTFRKDSEAPEDVQIILRQQFYRAGNGEKANVLFLGDSSGLMGINYSALQEKIGVSVKSLCAIGYLGPAGYGKLLLRHVESASKPDYVVLVLSPGSFHRDITWEYWVKFLDTLVSEEVTPPPLLPGGLKENIFTTISTVQNIVQNGLLGPWIFKAARGQFGVFYGTYWNYANAVKTNGCLIDPGAGLQPSFSHPKINPISDSFPGMTAKDMPILTSKHPESATQLLLEACKRLRSDIERAGIDKSRVFLVITPYLKGSGLDAEFQEHRMRAVAGILNELGLQKNAIVQLPMSLDASEFSTATHLNRWGREVFTQILSEALKKKMALLESK